MHTRSFASRYPFIVRMYPLFLTLAALFAATLLHTQTQAQGLRVSPNLSLNLAAQDSRQRSADFIVAVVNSEPVTHYQVRNRIAEIERQSDNSPGALPPAQQLYAQALETLILERVQVQQAREIGIRVDDAAIDNALQSIARQNQLSIEQLRQRLRADGIDINALRNDLRDQLLLQRVREREVEPRARVSDAELNAFLRERSPGAAVSRQTRARHILLRTDATQSESAARIKLFDLRKKIMTGEDFAVVAQEHSQDGSAREGGDLGWAAPGQFVPEFEQAMNALAPGQVSEPVTSRFGVHLIQVQERRERQLDEREQREAARAVLREKKLDEALEQWAQELRARAYIEMR